MSDYTKDYVDNFPKLKWLEEYLIGHNGFISGGCFKNAIMGEPVKDIDVFFNGDLDFCKAVICFRENKDFVKAYETERVSAFKKKESDITVELVRTVFGNPKDVMDNFDFTVTKMAMYKDEYDNRYKVLYHNRFFEDLCMKRLVIDCKNMTMPLGVFNRSLRYTKYGFNMCRESKLMLMNNILEYALVRNLSEFKMEDFTRELYDGID
jgi:hypothetical protein